MSNPLIGKVILGMKIAKDRQALLFVTNAGDIVVLADADCCSETWIQHIELPALGFPARVISAEDLELNKDDIWNADGDCIAFYGFKIVTDRGEIIIDYRNASNGYYGGSLVWPGEFFYGGVFSQNVSELEWADINPNDDQQNEEPNKWP